VTVKRWLIRIAGVALLVLGAALWARADEPPVVGAVPPPPQVLPHATPAPFPAPRPSYFGPSARPDPRPIADPAERLVQLSVPAAPAPVVAPTAAASSTAPAAAPAIVITIPHDEHMHWTRVRHVHFPSWPARPAKAAPVPPAERLAEPVRATPQAPSKFGAFFRR
jgi:hypothetical protein